MQGYFAKIDALSDIGEVLWYAVSVCEEQGVVRQTYHFKPVFDRGSSLGKVVHTKGFDREWLQFYDESDFRSKDPIPERTMKFGAFLTWQQARKLAVNTPENELYFAAMDKFRLIHGFGLPLFGARGRNAYASFDFNYPVERVPVEKMALVRSIAQAAHQRVCVLLDATYEPVDLSQREHEVLRWLAEGKSFPVTAQILDLSPDTVKTYAKRIYAKLGTADRTAAVVKAIKLGLVNA